MATASGPPSTRAARPAPVQSSRVKVLLSCTTVRYRMESEHTQPYGAAMSVTYAPSFTSLALRDQPPPDWADVVVESLPESLRDETDPGRWAAEIFSVPSNKPAVAGLMALRQVVAPLV